MADELEESKQQRHAALAAEHRRKAEFHDTHAGDATAPSVGGGQPNAGAQAGGFVAAIAEHKWAIIIGIAVVILVVIAFNIVSGNSSNTSSTTTGNSSPDLSQGGYIPSNITDALDSINTQLSGIGNQLGSGTTTTGGGTTGGGTTGGTPSSQSGYAPGQVFKNVNSGVLHYVVMPGQDLSQIAQEFGLNVSSISGIPENKNTGVIPKGLKGNVGNYKPKAGSVLVLPGKAISANSWYQVTQNMNLQSIASTEGISLSRIEQLNPNLPTDTYLTPGTEVKYA